MTLSLEPNRDATIHDPRGREQEYRAVYVAEVPGYEYLVIELGKLPNSEARYLVRIEVEQITDSGAAE